MTANMAQSVRDRLLRRARERGEDYNFLLNRFAVERFLYRLSLSPHRDRFVLKGATLFAAWAAQPYRATRDIDLEGFGPTVVAEKWEAMVSLGIGNSRMKDFYDAWILARDFTFDGAVLAAAIGATFARRSTILPADPPTALTAAFTEDPAKKRQWQAFLRRGGAVGAPNTIVATITALEPFLMPPTRALVAGQHFTPYWPAGGPWSERAEG